METKSTLWYLIPLWGISLLLAIAYVWEAALPKLVGDAVAVAQFEAFGYSRAFRLTIGVAEAIGAGLLLSQRGRLVGVGILIVVMLGAIYSHLATGFGSPVHAARNTGLLVLVAVLHELHRRRQSAR